MKVENSDKITCYNLQFSHIVSFYTLGALEPEIKSAMVPIIGAVCVLATAGTEDVRCDCTAGNSQVVTKRSREYTKSN